MVWGPPCGLRCGVGDSGTVLLWAICGTGFDILLLFCSLALPTHPPTHPHVRTHSFLKEHVEPAALIADFLPVRDRLVFLQTHKYVQRLYLCVCVCVVHSPRILLRFRLVHRVRLPPKRLKPLLFNGPSRELTFLYCATSSCTPTSPTSASAGVAGCKAGEGASGAGAMGKQEAQAAYLSQCLSLEVRYRGSFLSRAVPLRLVASSLHRVIRSWLNDKLGKQGFSIIMNMVNKLLTVFRPTEEVWYAIANSFGEDGSSLLTHACANPRIPLPVIQKLLEIPCFDLGLPDRNSGRNAIQLAHHFEREDLLTLFASLVAA